MGRKVVLHVWHKRKNKSCLPSLNVYWLGHEVLKDRLRSSHARRGFLVTAAARQTRTPSLSPFSTVGGNGSDPVLTQLDPEQALFQLPPFSGKRMISTGLLEAPGSVRAQIFAHGRCWKALWESFQMKSRNHKVWRRASLASLGWAVFSRGKTSIF